MTDLSPTERTALEIQALANETANRIGPCVTMLRQYKRGYPTGGDGSGDGTSRTEALGISPPDIIDREQRELVACLDRALRAMQVAYNITARYQKPCRPDNPGDDPVEEIWCTNHVRGHLFRVSKPGLGGLCDFCWSYRNESKRLPSVPIMKRLEETGRAPRVKAV